MTEIVNPHLMLRSQMVSAEHQRNPPTPLTQKSKKAKHSKDYSPPIAYAHTDGILRSSLADPLPHRERSMRGERKRGEL